ncbi:hypothetical protein B0T16DRAFT_454040 [Cercophora newfieldiana]|uniref:Uncharacterized protein n=1 Tax=Cercophora newfieldiana TaxID=92897 RepID=A0AA39YFI1_9PEZI|nr:hypothetical protein B0T16DRAFT_454040 [Cercophora newfieldiana]
MTQTPAPSRFLLPSKRPNTQQPQHHEQTPNQQLHTNGPHRFHATPRFSAATPGTGTPVTRSSTPALPPSVKPATTRSSRSQLVQEIIDDGSSQPSIAGLSAAPSPDRQPYLPDAFDIDSSFVSQSPYSKPAYERQIPYNGRSPKRRRISIASSDSDPDIVADSQPPAGASPFTSRPASPHIEDLILPDTPSDEEDDDDEQEEPDTLSINATSSPIPSAPRSPSLSISISASSSPSPSSPSSPSNYHHNRHPKNHHHQNNPNPQQHQPTFHPPPRFKPPPDGGAKPPLPSETNLATIFSPHRRGTRYLPGGLASELRDWLVEIKETDLDPASHQPHAAVRLAVEQVRHGGAGMTLIEGRPIGEGGVLGGRAKAILTGEGMLGGQGAGLGGGDGNGAGRKVKTGAVVAVAPPAWDVEIGERWAVAYWWGVVAEKEKEGERGDGDGDGGVG